MTLDAVPGVADPAEGAAVPEPSAPNVVRLRDGNEVTLAPEVTTAIAVAVMAVIREGGPSVPVVIGRLSEVYLDTAIIGWTFRDATGQPEPITPENRRRLLTVANGSVDVAERADDLYMPAISVPLAARMPVRSLNGQTGDSTSPTPGSGSTSPTRSTRSSRGRSGGKRSHL